MKTHPFVWRFVLVCEVALSCLLVHAPTPLLAAPGTDDRLTDSDHAGENPTTPTSNSLRKLEEAGKASATCAWPALPTTWAEISAELKEGQLLTGAQDFDALKPAEQVRVAGTYLDLKFLGVRDALAASVGQLKGKLESEDRHKGLYLGDLDTFLKGYELRRFLLNGTTQSFEDMLNKELPQEWQDAYNAELQAYADAIPGAGHLVLQPAATLGEVTAQFFQVVGQTCQSHEHLSAQQKRAETTCQRLAKQEELVQDFSFIHPLKTLHPSYKPDVFFSLLSLCLHQACQMAVLPFTAKDTKLHGSIEPPCQVIAHDFAHAKLSCAEIRNDMPAPVCYPVFWMFSIHTIVNTISHETSLSLQDKKLLWGSFVMMHERLFCATTTTPTLACLRSPALQASLENPCFLDPGVLDGIKRGVGVDETPRSCALHFLDTFEQSPEFQQYQAFEAMTKELLAHVPQDQHESIPEHLIH